MLVIPSGSTSRYNLQRSLRLRKSASAFLSRTPGGVGGASSQTFSFWVKLGAIGAALPIRDAFFNSTNYAFIGITATGAIRIFQYEGGVTTCDKNTVALFRDPSTWYHVVVNADFARASGDKYRIFVNGAQQATTGTDNPTSQLWPYPSYTQQIGYSWAYGSYFDGLLAEVNFIDGQALTPSSFGEIDATTGVWKPKKYTGTYGTNGFYLPFTDNSALTTASNVGLGKDYSGNGNYWVTGNISITAGSTYDSFTDVPTLTSSTAANYATFNPLVVNNASGQTPQIYYAANTEVRAFSDTGAVTYSHTQATQVLTGLKYWEVTLISATTNDALIGIVNLASSTLVCQGKGVPGLIYSGNGGGYYRSGSVYATGSTVNASGASYTTGDVLGVAYDATTQKLWFSKNGVWQGAGADPSTGSNPNVSNLPVSGEYVPAVSQYNSSSAQYAEFRLNCGQRPFAYTPPSGFLPLNTFNLPAPAIVRGNKYFDVVTRSGTGAALTQPLGFQPDFLWSKCRTVAVDHNLLDSARGFDKVLFSNLTSAEDTSNAFGVTTSGSGYGTNGAASINGAGRTYVDWLWKKSATAGFDIVAFTSPASGNATYSHALGVSPAMVIIKARGAVSSWTVWHKSFSAPLDDYLNLQSTNPKLTSAGLWGTGHTSSVFSVGTGSYVASQTYIAYLWAEIAGFSKFGSYTGNGSTDGPFVYCGFRPRFLMVKRTDSTSDWAIHDTARDGSNVSASELYPSVSNAEATASTLNVDFLSNGFKVRSTIYNASGGTYIFCAFAEHPFKYALAR